MPDQPQGDKTEEPTPKRLEEAVRNGQIARSPEIQTVFVMGAGLLALTVFAGQIWGRFVQATSSILGHLHELEFTKDEVPGHFAAGVLFVGHCCAPICLAALAAGLLAGAVQTRFQASPDALKAKWSKLNPVEGFKRVFSWKQWAPALLSIFKLAIIIGLLHGTLRAIADDPIFYTVVDAARIADYLAVSTHTLTARVLAIMVVIAGLDYIYQRWRTREDLKMTRQEVKDEHKNTEGDPEIKAQRKRMARGGSKRRMLDAVPEADVIITNPTHYAVALKYDPASADAPRVVAKGMRLFALRIRAVARKHGVPVREDKPLARFIYRHCPVDGEIPAELFAAVAKILAAVYRENRYRYFRKGAG